MLTIMCQAVHTLPDTAIVYTEHTSQTARHHTCCLSVSKCTWSHRATYHQVVLNETSEVLETPLLSYVILNTCFRTLIN